MFTNNFIKVQKMIFMGQQQTLVDHTGSASDAYANVSNFGKAAQFGSMMGNVYAGTPSSSGLYFGTGSTPATVNDYTLEAPITSGMSVTKGTVLLGKESDGVYAAMASHTIKNTSDTLINIYEAGVYGAIGYGNDSGYEKPFLLERTVLTEPISLQPGEEKIVTYKITFNQVLNVD